MKLQIGKYIEGKQKKLVDATIKYFNDHAKRIFPLVDEDDEGIMYWEDSKHVKVKFKKMTVEKGYLKTVELFRKARILKYAKIYIENEYVMVELP